ncbi:MAG: hypothetical protein ACP5IO_04955 [Elusimicrobiales bacterium]
MRLLMGVFFAMMIMPCLLQAKNNVKKGDVKTNVSVSTTTSTATSSISNKSQQLYDEGSEVLVDSSIHLGQSGGSQSEEEGIPYGFGMLKGVIILEGKATLVFEGDDGTISFIQVYKMGDFVKWKVYLQVKRT